MFLRRTLMLWTHFSITRNLTKLELRCSWSGPVCQWTILLLTILSDFSFLLWIALAIYDVWYVRPTLLYIIPAVLYMLYVATYEYVLHYLWNQVIIQQTKLHFAVINILIPHFLCNLILPFICPILLSCPWHSLCQFPHCVPSSGSTGSMMSSMSIKSWS